jgi:hypothetical protein
MDQEPEPGPPTVDALASLYAERTSQLKAVGAPSSWL